MNNIIDALQREIPENPNVSQSVSEMPMAHEEQNTPIIGIEMLANQDKVNHETHNTTPSVPISFSTNNEQTNTYNESSFPTVHHNSEYNDKNSVIENDDDDNESEISVDEKSDEVIAEKRKLLFKIYCMEKKGIILNKKYTMGNSLQELQYEFDRISHEFQVNNSIKFAQKMLMMCVTGVEYLNNKFDPFDVMLDGWSENVHENITDYDEVFGELYEKYHSTASMAPEIKLMLMLGGSGFMFHLTNTMFKNNMNVPSMMQNLQSKIRRPPTMSSSAMNNSRQPQMNGPIGVDSILTELKDNDSDINSMSDDSQSVISDISNGSIGFASQGKRKRGKKPSMHLNL